MDPIAFGLTKEDVDLIATRYFQEKRDKNKFRVLSYHVKRLSEEPIGFLGDHYFLNLVMSKQMPDCSEAEESVELFMKVLPEKVPKLAQYIEEMGCFKKEIQLYTGLIPRLQDIISGTDSFAPRAYLAKDDKMLVLENLTVAGYRMVENTKNLLDFPHLVVALKTVAKLHAASLVLEERTKQRITELYPGHLNENAYIDDDAYVRKTNLDNAIRAFCELIKRIDKYSKSEWLDYILEKFPSVIRQIYEFSKPSSVYRNVVNHGDLWNNNLMFKYEENNNSQPSGTAGSSSPVAGILLDYQLTRYAPPALDVYTVITIGSSSDFRARHLDMLVNAYYAALTQELADHKIDVTDILPRSEFTASCDHYRLAGLIENCLFSLTILIPMDIAKPLMGSSESFDDFIRDGKTKVELALKSFEQDDTFRHRLTDMLSEIIEKYIL